ncbi:hypothetical protein [Lacihabitans soyangensis]|uniref:hypothetical protein n=1 Tax=Lacihabitans soyangensis TaxID=869394 RepID=UPI0020CDDED1|nr:hypothetical protein [Lacihabitans soyangensis]
MIYTFKLYEVRYEVKEMLFKKIPKESLISIEKPLGFDNREFEYEGVMYDVVEVKIEKDKKILFCFADIKETELGLNFEKNLDFLWSKNPVRKDVSSKLVDFFKSILSYHKLPKFYIFSLKINKVEFLSIITNTIEEHFSIHLPPPEHSKILLV